LRLRLATYQDAFGPANLRMLPLLVVQAGSLSMLWLMATGALDDPVPSAILGSLAAVSACWATSSLATIATSPRVRRQDLLVTWRLALLLPGGAAAAGDLPGGAVDGLATAVQPRLADGAAAGCGGRDQHRGGHVRLPDPRPPRGSARPAGRRRLIRPGRRSDIPSRAIPWWTPAPGPARRSV